MAATVSLEIQLARSICSIFPLCMESNALEKSTDNSATSSFFFLHEYFLGFDELWCESFSPKDILVIPKYILNFTFNAVESQCIVNLDCYGSKGYISIVLGYSKVTLLAEREEAALCPTVDYILVIYVVAVWEQYVVEFPCLPYFWGYFIKPCSFPIFNFSSYYAEFLCKLSWLDV